MEDKQRQPNGALIVHADGAIGDGRRATGLGFIVRDARGQVLHLGRKQSGTMTNNEAEYAAIYFALETMRDWRLAREREVRVFSDSRVVVEQLRGEVSVHSPTLQRWHQRTKTLLRQFKRVRFAHVAREENRLADALANEALKGFQI